MRTWSLRLLRQPFRLALSALHMLATAASAAFKSRATLHLENLALRHQLTVLRRPVKRPKLTSADRFLWTCAQLSRETRTNSTPAGRVNADIKNLDLALTHASNATVGH